MARVYLVRGNNCQLANQLVLFASVYAWCIERGHTLCNPSFSDYAHLFDNLGGPLVSPLVPGPWLNAGATRRRQRLWRFVADLPGSPMGPLVSARQRDPVIHLPPTSSDWKEPVTRGDGRVFLSGWNFRNPVGLIKHHAAIVQAFRPRQPERERVLAWAAGLDRSRLNVGVHIRHGDYRAFLGGRFYFTVEQHAEAMRRIAERYRDLRPCFHVFSNEARRPDEFAGLDVRVCSGSAIEDLYRLGACDLIVGAMSTFSLWAAIYGDPAGQRGRSLVWHLGRVDGDEFGWFSEGHPSVIRLEDADPHIYSRFAAIKNSGGR